MTSKHLKGRLKPPVGNVTFFNHGGRLGPPVRVFTFFKQGGRSGPPFRNITFFLITRSYAALRAADLDWIVWPGYSLGGYILEKTMKTDLKP